MSPSRCLAERARVSGVCPDEHVELPDLNRERVVELKLDGTKEAELYRMLLVAQCNALHSAMPFLFEKIEDETELVLPNNLLHSDSLIRKLVNEIDEEDCLVVQCQRGREIHGRRGLANATLLIRDRHRSGHPPTLPDYPTRSLAPSRILAGGQGAE